MSLWNGQVNNRMSPFSASAQLFSVFLKGLYLSVLLLSWKIAATDPLSSKIGCPQNCHCQQKTINCSGANLVAVPRISSGSKQVTSLILTNNSLEEITYRDFEQFEDLENLDLSDNRIYAIHNESFLPLGNLTTLHLGGNSLKAIPLNCFAGLTTLRTLDLGNNQLREVPTEALESLQSLETLVLAKNNISKLKDCSFERLHALKFLQLGNNKISKLSDKAFAITCVMGANPDLYPCPIQSLDLAGNQLTDIDPNTLGWLQKLETLNLDANNFVSIKTGVFQNMPLLEILYLSFMPELTEVQVNSFRNLEKLIELRIRNCPRLSTLSEGAFYNIPEIKILQMNNNSLKTIPENLINWDFLSEADFHGNPLICDCNLKWIQDKFKSNNGTPNAREIVCHSPDKLQGIKLIDVRPDLLVCKKPPKTPNERLKTALGAVVVCLCLVLIITVSIKFRNRICIVVKRQFRYKAHRDNARELFSVKISDITEDHEPEAVSEEVTLSPNRRGRGLVDAYT